MKRSALVVALAAAFGGCYEAPEALSGTDVLTLNATPNTVLADGSSTVDLSVHLKSDSAPGTVVHLQVSSGVVNFAADPTSADARELDVKFAGAGDTVVPLQAGLLAGPLLVTASAGDVSSHISVQLTPTPVDRLALTVDRTRVRADGLTPINVAAQLSAQTAGAHVSIGTQVNFKVCCVDAEIQAPRDCEATPLLSVPPFATVAANDTASVRAIASLNDAENGQGGAGGEPVTQEYFIVADAVSPPACAQPNRASSAAVRVAVLPTP